MEMVVEWSCWVHDWDGDRDGEGGSRMAVMGELAKVLLIHVFYKKKRPSIFFCQCTTFGVMTE